MLLLCRCWRFARVAHGVYVTSNEKEEERLLDSWEERHSSQKSLQNSQSPKS